MGRTSSSSKKKSSKKKIPKISSETRRKKRSRKIKSKKLRRHDESMSSFSDDELSRSLSVSLSSSEDDYRSRKSRSRKRDVKGSKKRARRSSSSRSSSVDSPRIKKKKRNGESESRKKLSKKKKKKTKKLKRYSSISSASSDTHSCSTCHGESDSETLRERSREKKKSKRNSGRGRSITRKSIDRSRSVSLCSKLSDSVSNNTFELFAVETNPRRLRSVITIVTRESESEGNEENKDEFKEEIVYDHDDYPSPRSNDSNEADNKREPAYRTMESVIGDDPSVSNLKASEPISTSKNGSDKSFDGAGNVSPKVKESDVKDLELILRQRALENLKRFKGGQQANEVVPVDEKDKSNTEMKPLSKAEPELVPNKQAVEKIKRDRGGSQRNEVGLVDDINKSNNEIKLLSTGEEAEFLPSSQLKQEDPGMRKSRFTWRRDSSLSTENKEKIAPKKNGGSDSAAAKLTDATLRHLGLHGRSDEKARNVRPIASRLQTLPRSNSSLTDRRVNKSVDGGSETLGESSSNAGDIGISDARGSTVVETPSGGLAEEGGSSREKQNDAKDGSQFEQKTMTVMRGGELVQVNYKVYIPKKVPALARRQLKR